MDTKKQTSYLFFQTKVAFASNKKPHPSLPLPPWPLAGGKAVRQWEKARLLSFACLPKGRGLWQGQRPKRQLTCLPKVNTEKTKFVLGLLRGNKQSFFCKKNFVILSTMFKFSIKKHNEKFKTLFAI